MKLHATGGYQKHKCFMRFEDQCSYKYLLNSASIGYANKFKYLLLCGSVVIYVQVCSASSRPISGNLGSSRPPWLARAGRDAAQGVLRVW